MEDAKEIGLRKQMNPWVYGPVADSFSVLSGITINLILLLFYPWIKEFTLPLFVLFTFQTLAVLHAWSTSYVVLFSDLFRPLRERDPERFVLVPLVIVLFSMALGILVAKTVVIPEGPSVDGKSFLFYFFYSGIFMVGHFWHFGRQDFGVLSLYRQRAQQVEPLDRNVDQWFSQIMMYVIQPCIYFRAFALYPFTVMVGWLAPLDSWFSALAHGAAALAVLCFFCVAFLEFRKPRRSIPKLLYYLVMASHPLFLYAGTFENSSTLPFPLLWQVSYFVSHWLIAILLTHKVNSSHLTRSAGSRWKATFLHFFPLLGLVSATSILLYFYGNQSILSGRDYLGVRAVLHQIKPEATLIAGIFFGYSLAEQLVHYWCDRCLYRFQDEKTRARVAPLL